MDTENPSQNGSTTSFSKTRPSWKAEFGRITLQYLLVRLIIDLIELVTDVVLEVIIRAERKNRIIQESYKRQDSSEESSGL